MVDFTSLSPKNLARLYIALLIGVPFCVVFLWSVWDFWVRPMFVPWREIEEKADDLIEQYGDDADYHAMMEQRRAAHRCETYEEGLWRRIRRAIRARN